VIPLGDRVNIRAHIRAQHLLDMHIILAICVCTLKNIFVSGVGRSELVDSDGELFLMNKADLIKHG
jgi:hypothetical protein